MRQSRKNYERVFGGLHRGSATERSTTLQNFHIPSTFGARCDGTLQAMDTIERGRDMDRIDERQLVPQPKSRVCRVLDRAKRRSARTSIALAVAIALGAGSYYGWNAWSGSAQT